MSDLTLALDETKTPPFVKVHLRGDAANPRRIVGFSGEGVGYKIGGSDIPGCVKIFRGRETRIFPLSIVEVIDVNL